MQTTNTIPKGITMNNTPQIFLLPLKKGKKKVTFTLEVDVPENCKSLYLSVACEARLLGEKIVVSRKIEKAYLPAKMLKHTIETQKGTKIYE